MIVHIKNIDIINVEIMKDKQVISLTVDGMEND